MSNCLQLFNKLNGSIDNANDQIINNMTDGSTEYIHSCIKPFVTFDHYSELLQTSWNSIFDDLAESNECSNSVLSKAKTVFDYSYNVRNVDDVVKQYLKQDSSHKQVMTDDLSATLKNIAGVVVHHCNCKMLTLFKIVLEKYKKKYGEKFTGKSKQEIKQIVEDDYNKFYNIIVSSLKNNEMPYQNNFLQKLSAKLTNLYNFSVDSELNMLIPDELGSLKQFFIRIITQYYKNLHPIIWAQIFKSITKNIFVELPFTEKQIFSFLSKHVLLNSGPFILKILQMIRPVLTPELAEKYNLTKLTYPLMEPHQVDTILRRSVNNWDMYRILANYSASVGHVCKVIRTDNPSNVFIIKIIKPLAIAQSCWEYKTLHKLFPEGSCEQHFIINMLESNGREMFIENENENIRKGHSLYTMSYNQLYGGIDLDAKLTTVQQIPNVIRSNSWFVNAMTLAPGVPLSKLIESNELEHDTKYRAKLHRCLDLLVYKFFHNIVQNGFYHGDLHSGNIFYSYAKSQVTLIDFGAVGTIDIYDNSSEINSLIDVVIMSSFNNYADILDATTKLLNSKCVETQIDPTTSAYTELKNKLVEYQIINIQNKQKDNKNTQMFENYMVDDRRIQEEKSEPFKEQYPDKIYNLNSIYSLIDSSVTEQETVVENRDVLSDYLTVQNSDSISFTKVLEEIITFYAKSGVNIAIKFNELYEFQKAYALILGVLHKVHYNSYRTNIMIKHAISSWKNLSKLSHFSTVKHAIQSYSAQKSKYKQFVKTYNLS